MANDRELWSGIPIPLDGLPLIVEPRYPYAAEITKAFGPRLDDDDEGIVLRNRFYSRRHRCDVYIYHEPLEGGRVRHGMLPAVHGMRHMAKTLEASAAWGIEQESNAVQTLGTLVSHHQMKCYLLTGMFAERSRRSGLLYIFRKLRPTIVIESRDDSIRYQIGALAAKPGIEPRIMCCLCMHPIAYYSESWAGAMCPTDDVIAHLMLMRGDEPMLWRRANQHAPYRPEAGL